ncbi:MAG: SpoVA/SpoVAEb family sporulation membrane protein [Streptococcus sp.]
MFKINSWTYYESIVVIMLLDLFHIYDKLVEIFHAGALLPITSFGHSLMHGPWQLKNLKRISDGYFDLTAAVLVVLFYLLLVAICTKPKS